MGKSTTNRCPNCFSELVVKNGHHYGGKLQFLCRSCNKHFTAETALGYPPTNISYPVIAYLLYFRRRVPDFSDMRKYRRFVNYWLVYLRFSKGEVSRQTVHHWIKNFDSLLDSVISFDESKKFVHSRLDELVGMRPSAKSVFYSDSLRFLERKFGKKFLFDLLKSDEVFFRELVDVVGKHGVFCWEFDDKKGVNGLR
jgi:hypothetical protein